MYLKSSSPKWRPFCPGGDGLAICPQKYQLGINSTRLPNPREHAESHLLCESITWATGLCVFLLIFAHTRAHTHTHEVICQKWNNWNKPTGIRLSLELTERYSRWLQGIYQSGGTISLLGGLYVSGVMPQYISPNQITAWYAFASSCNKFWSRGANILQLNPSPSGCNGIRIYVYI